MDDYKIDMNTLQLLYQIDYQKYTVQNKLNVYFTVPRACVDYGSDVNGYFTINPELKTGRSSKFKALCQNGEYICKTLIFQWVK